MESILSVIFFLGSGLYKHFSSNPSGLTEYCNKLREFQKFKNDEIVEW